MTTLILSAFPLAVAISTAQVAGAQQQPAIRPIGAVVATSRETFGPANVWVRALVSGAVLVNDVQNRRVVMLDSTLTLVQVVADTTSATANAYSGRSGSLIAYRGDSTLFVDPQSMTMLVIDGGGNVGRTMALPRSQDAMTLGNAMFGGATFDGQGRIVYRASPNFQMMRPAGGRAAAGGGGGAPPMVAPEMPDSTPIIRVDLASRAVDTIGYIKIPKMKMDVSRDDNGRMTMTSQMNPLPTVDDFAVLTDGSVALIRGRDYHIDWMRPDGTRESSAKIPFDWRRLSDEDKVAFIDSVKAQRERMAAAAATQAAPGAAGAAGAAGGGGAGGMASGEVRVMIGGPGGGGPPGPGGGPGRVNMTFVPASELPDYQPVFFSGAARADADGRVWIRITPTKALTSGPVYDVINGKGELVDRVQLPKDRTIVGFGRGGVVYLAARSGNSQTIERTTSK